MYSAESTPSRRDFLRALKGAVYVGGAAVLSSAATKLLLDEQSPQEMLVALLKKSGKKREINEKGLNGFAYTSDKLRFPQYVVEAEYMEAKKPGTAEDEETLVLRVNKKNGKDAGDYVFTDKLPLGVLDFYEFTGPSGFSRRRPTHPEFKENQDEYNNIIGDILKALSSGK